jgi:type I restriction enzyme M protein
MATSFAVKQTGLFTHNFDNIEQLESSLWEAADLLRANSKLTSSEYCMPVLGVIFLRHATNRFEAAKQQIATDQAAGKMPRRKPVKADFVRRRALFLPDVAHYDAIATLPKSANLGEALVAAMTAIEDDFEPLKNQLPKEYEGFANDLLENLIRTFNSEVLRKAGGDVFGRIYEYFLMKFAMQGAQDNGEFFTPPSLVQTIVNVIEPEHGIVFDPACGSGGMFVQTSHFLEARGEDTGHKVSFYGHEKTGTTIRLAKMNLAVHGLEGDIREANTFYEDPHPIWGKCDFVMANPPFNVDMVDAKVETDRRLPFGLPGVNKEKKVSNGNYLWISYFHSYLGPGGRAGFVMSSQASSAGNKETEVRRKIVETGDVDVMISIRSNFFYTRTVPCELWHFDRGKPAERKDKVLMIDARNVYRKVTRKIYDFSPEQLANLTAIVWLYRGQQQRFLDLVRSYFEQCYRELALAPSSLKKFDSDLGMLLEPLELFAKATAERRAVAGRAVLSSDERATATSPPASAGGSALAELKQSLAAYHTDRAALIAAAEDFCLRHCKPMPSTNDAQHTARKVLDGLAEQARGFVKQIDLLFKLANRATSAAGELAADERLAEFYDRRAVSKRLKQVEQERDRAAAQLKQLTYFHRQIAWLQERFPKAEFAAVLGLCKIVSREEIKAADWSLTSGRYVGVAPAEIDEEFDFEQALRDIHVELEDLNQEAVQLAALIRANLEAMI